MSKVFIDTNILVYAIDKSDLHKQRISRKILLELEKNNLGVISTQVLQELYVTLTKKLHVDPIFSKQIIDQFTNFEVIQVDAPLILQAIDCSILNQISFWDALIVVAAQTGGCERLLSEDFNHQQTFKNIRVDNIFK